MMKVPLPRARLDVKNAAFEEAFAQAVTVGTEDVQEGMAALLEKRTPDFKERDALEMATKKGAP